MKNMMDCEAICTWPNGEKRTVHVVRDDGAECYIIWNEKVESECKAVVGFEEIVPVHWLEKTP